MPPTPTILWERRWDPGAVNPGPRSLFGSFIKTDTSRCNESYLAAAAAAAATAALSWEEAKDAANSQWKWHRCQMSLTTLPTFCMTNCVVCLIATIGGSGSLVGQIAAGAEDPFMKQTDVGLLVSYSTIHMRIVAHAKY